MDAMRTAVIDLGTNTFHLIIADLLEGAVNVIHKANDPVKLGEGRLNENIIIPEAFQRGLDTLKNYRQTMEAYGVTTVKATATSAVRSAKNGEDFVEAVKSYTGIAIEIISGDEEAFYIYNGVKATGVLTETSLVMDIGGGSTEFIICNKESLLWKKSYNLGAARLSQAFFKSDPISENEQSSIENKLSSELEDLLDACHRFKPKVLIGSAGAFETYATLLNEDIDLSSTAFLELNLAAYQQLAFQLISSTHNERASLKGLIPLRVDMIVIASIITNHIISKCNLQSLYLSTYDLKMGVLQVLASEKQSRNS
jgi:exopolyphosphatase/guanosine-5'-triphosphate,3'-diphosphate pyrophosphatase